MPTKTYGSLGVFIVIEESSTIEYDVFESSIDAIEHGAVLSMRYAPYVDTDTAHKMYASMRAKHYVDVIEAYNADQNRRGAAHRISIIGAPFKKSKRRRNAGRKGSAP